MEELHGHTLEYWKNNAEEDYIKVPISVLKYITCLEAENKQLILSGVSQRSKLLFAFEEYWNTNNCDGENFGNVVDRFLANNCG